MSQTADVKKKSDKMPAAIPYIVANEAAERFNFYGFKAILTTFLLAQFYNPTGNTDPAFVQAAQATAGAKTHDFVAMSYLLPLFGGLMADWFWGKYKTILWLSIVYAIGNILLASSVNSELLFTSSLMIIAMGAGGIKPCVSSNVGDQFDSSNEHLISKAFDAFYASINFGSLLSILLIPYLKREFGYQVAFAVPAASMVLATLFFYSGRAKYVKVPPRSVGDKNRIVIMLTSFLTLLASYIYFDKIKEMGMGPVLGAWAILIIVVALVFKKQWFAKPGNFVGINLYALMNGGFDSAAKEYGDKTIEGIRSVWRVLAVFAFIPVFWGLWDQSQAEWTIQAQKMDLNFMGLKWEAEQISVANALFILIFIPLFSYVVYPTIERMGIKVTPKGKIGVGFIMTALAFVISAIIEQWIEAGQTPNIAWQILAFVVLTIGELLISLTGLEYAYTQSPPSMKSTLTACWLLTVTLGNVLVSVIQNSIKNGGFFSAYTGSKFYWLFMAICGVTGIIFMIVSPFIKEKSYIGVTED